MPSGLNEKPRGLLKWRLLGRVGASLGVALAAYTGDRTFVEIKNLADEKEDGLFVNTYTDDLDALIALLEQARKEKTP